MMHHRIWLAAVFASLLAFQPVQADEFDLLMEDVIDIPQSDDSWDDIYVEERACIPRNGRTPRYPVVLLHGFMGFDEIFKLEYFYRIKGDYTQSCIQVFTPVVPAINYIQVRAEELAPQIDQILAQTGAKKVNLIAHSMGGLDARYLISTLGYGDRVASLTTIGTPHRGSPVTEMIWALLGKGDNILYDAFGFIAGAIMSNGKYLDSDLHGALLNLSPTYLNSFFNPANPDDPRVYYQSYGGITSITGITTGDIIDPLFLPFRPAFIGHGQNDGLVSVASTKWGNYRGILRADHIDIIGQLFGSTGLFFNHRKFYKNIVEDLAKRGF